jgi:hypothetical protein
MIYLISPNQVKPNRVETQEVDKDEEYHLRYARWAIGSGYTQSHAAYIANYQTNRKFYMNRQWVMQEDLEAFFKDESGQDRNRLKVTRNYIQPMVETYRGNAERMTFNMKVTNLSPLARSRRDMALHRLLAYNDVTRVMPGFKSSLRDNNIPVGDEAEVTEKFNTLYNDQHVIAANRLVRYSKDINKLDEYRGVMARDVALAGITIMRPFPYSGEWMFRRVAPDRFGWDRSALDPCLLDADYFFEDELASVSTLFEKYQSMGVDERKAVEKYCTDYTKQNPGVPIDLSISGKVPVFHALWRDMVIDWYGYVNDQFGQRILARINYIEENETEPRYTNKDLIPYSQLTEYQKKVLKYSSSGMTQLYVDLWRYCDFIPVEAVPVRKEHRKVRDIVLECGIVPYQEPDPYKPTNMLPPYKVGTWSYLDGELISPVDVVINPQRMINRFLSVMENQINNSGGAGVVFDKDLSVDGYQSEDDLRTKINRGEAIGVNAKGKGVQNIFGRYDSTPKEAIVAFSNLIESFKLGIEQVTGVNEAVKGESNNPDQLVGVMQLMIQRGSIIQEPFYKAIMDCFRGCYQSIITSGKRYYIDNDIELMDAIGEDSASILKLSKDMRNESMRITLTRSMDDANERLTVDSLLITWLQFGLVDQDVVSKLTGRATMEEALFEMREYQKRLAVQKRMAAQQQQAQTAQQQNVQEQAGQVLYGESIRDKAREDINKQADRDLKLQIANK